MVRVGSFLGGVLLLWSMASARVQAETAWRVPPWAHNHFLDATISGNMETYDKGLRGKPEHVIYDFEAGAFQRLSSWHEYGINAGQSLGVVPESSPAWWMAEWTAPVECNVIVLSGCYPNQPQPETAWKIELRSDGVWREHVRGVGGWYDDGRNEWRAPGGTPVTFDGFRVAVFSKDDKTPVDNVHFRGEKGVSWVVASIPDIDARLHVSKRRIRLGEAVDFRAEPVAGAIESWGWDFGDGTTVTGSAVQHGYTAPGTYTATLTFASATESVGLQTTVEVLPPVEARITPLEKSVRAGDAVSFDASGSLGKITEYTWNFDDGTSASGKTVNHTFSEPGIYGVRLTTRDGVYSHEGAALLRVHEVGTLAVPQLLLDTDQKNEQDDQYFLGYAVFSELDVVGVNSVHHGGGQEAINYAEILKVLDLSKQSGAPDARLPRVFRGADERLEVPGSGEWFDTLPIVTDAAKAILAAARGASPENPVWIVPVGPGTNVASAILMAREQGLDLEGRMRVMWLGGSNKAITQEFNGNNDPWSLYVVGQSGVELWIMPAPVGARVRIDKRTESDWYAHNPLGQYLQKITPAKDKPLYDPAVLSAIIDLRLDQGWVTEVESVVLGGPDDAYRWQHSDTPTNVTLIREIDQAAMKQDIFDTLKGKATPLKQ